VSRKNSRPVKKVPFYFRKILRTVYHTWIYILHRLCPSPHAIIIIIIIIIIQLNFIFPGQDLSPSLGKQVQIGPTQLGPKGKAAFKFIIIVRPGVVLFAFVTT
jgi:hypothetical protein